MLVCYILFQFCFLFIFGSNSNYKNTGHSFTKKLCDEKERRNDSYGSDDELEGWYSEDTKERTHVITLLDLTIDTLQEISKELKVTPPQKLSEMVPKIVVCISSKFFSWYYSNIKNAEWIHSLFLSTEQSDDASLLSNYEQFFAVLSKNIYRGYKLLDFVIEYLKYYEETKIIKLPMQIYAFRMLEAKFHKHDVEFICYSQESIENAFSQLSSSNFENEKEFKTFLNLNEFETEARNKNLQIRKMEKHEIWVTIRLIRSFLILLEDLKLSQIKVIKIREAFIKLIEVGCNFAEEMCEKKTGHYFFAYNGKSFVYFDRQKTTSEILFDRNDSIDIQFKLLESTIRDLSVQDVEKELSIF